MRDDDPRAGWLPDVVQQLANAAVRAGLVPLVEADYSDSDSVSLRGPGDVDLGVLCAYGRTPVLILSETEWDERMQEQLCVEIRGTEKITAWIAGTVDAATSPL